MQKLYIPGILEPVPERKANVSVIEVMVIDGPACFIHSTNLSVGFFFSELWSSALQITNISSTPIPSIKIGKASCDSFCSYPASKPM